MANIYWRAPSPEELVGTSYFVTDFTEETIEVWEENWDVLELYRQYSTQWRMAANGPVALDFAIFLHELDRKRVEESQYDRMVMQLRMIETEALKWIHKS